MSTDPTSAETATESWRLIIDESPRSGPSNMAIDQAIAEACAAGDSPPTLRFYRWEPPAISIGRHQDSAEIDHEQVAELGYEIVRRSTGGRAILHIDELTYSIAASKDHPIMGGGVMDSYLRISNALLAGLNNLNINVDKAGADVRAGKDVSAACFEVPSAYEITVNGRKLMGSAQSRRAGYVLQHGTLPLTGDVTRLVPLLTLPESEKEALTNQLTERACTLAYALAIEEDVEEDSPEVAFATVAAAICDGFRDTFGIELDEPPHHKQLLPSELRRAATLIREKYANAEWTNARSGIVH